MKSWKTTVGGILSGAGITFAQFFPEHAKFGNFAAALGTLLLGLAARDNNKSSEDVGAKNGGPVTDPIRQGLPGGTGPIVGLLLCIATLGFATGCKTVDGKSVPDSAKIAAASREAASLGTQEALLHHPEWLSGFHAAHDELARLETLDTVRASDLLAIIGRLPVNELKSDEARIAISGARLIIALAGWSEIDAERVQQIRPVITAIRQGLEDAGVK